MSAANIGQISVTLLLNLSQFTAGSKTAAERMQSLKSTGMTLFKTLGLGIAGYTAFKQVMFESVKAYLASEDANKRLTAALDGNIKKFKELETVADRLQQVTIFDDETIKDSMTFLAMQNRTQEEIKKTISAAVDYASVTGKELPDAVKDLNMTYEGNIGRLGRLDAKFKELTPEQLRNGAAIDLIKEKYNGFAEIIGETTEGKIRRFQNAMDELKEGIGQGLVEGAAEEFNSLSNSILGASVNAKDLGNIIGKGLLITFMSLFGFVIPAFKGFMIQLGQLKILFRELTSGVGSFALKLLDLPSKLPVVGNFFEQLKRKAEGYLNKLLEILGVQSALSEGSAINENKYTKDGKYIGDTRRRREQDPANQSNKSPVSGTSGTQQLEKEEEHLDRIEQLKKNISKAEEEYQKLVVKGYDERTAFMVDEMKKIKELKAELKELLEIQKDLAVQYTKFDRAEGTREMAQGTSRPGARPEASFKPDDEAWMKHWTSGINFATQIFNILNRRPEYMFQAFLQILAIVTQIASLISPVGGGFFGAITGLFGALGGLLGLKEGGRLDEGLIKGPGTPTSDSILAVAGSRLLRLSNKEYIVPAWMSFLYPMLEKIRMSKSVYSAGGGYRAGGALSKSALQLSSNGTIIFNQDGFVSETTATKIIRKGMPGFIIRMARKGSR